MRERNRRSGKTVTVDGIPEDILRQDVAMFCVRESHLKSFRYEGVGTVGEAIEYVTNHGTPSGLSGVVWADMISKMKLWKE